MSRRGVSSRGVSAIGSGAAGLGGPSSRAAPSTASSSSKPSTATPTPSSAARPVPTSTGPSSRSAAGSSSSSRIVAARGAGAGGGGGHLARVHDPSGRISEYWAQDDKCPQCKTDRLISPKLRLLVSPCYHKMCESCVDRIFSLGSAPCPQCGTTCRKNQFGVQTFSDLGVEREVDVRRRVAKVYNKQEKDFPTLQAYNDYLEEVEEITFNLINRIDLDRTEARIAMHEHANRSLINRNALSLSSASAALASAEEAERKWRKARAELLRRREEEDRELREREAREIVDLAASVGAGGGEGGVVATSAEGEDEGEAIAKLKKMQAQRRRERAESRRREDEEAERQRVAMMGALAASSSSSSSSTAGAGRQGHRSHHNSNGAGTADGTTSDVDPSQGLYRPWQPAMLLDFEGPLARLDDARALYDVGSPPPPLLGLGASEAGSGTSTNASAHAVGYVDFANEHPRSLDEARRVHVGGYDWAGVLRRRMRAAVEGLWIAPVS